jgi:hypothetical protein
MKEKYKVVEKHMNWETEMSAKIKCSKTIFIFGAIFFVISILSVSAADVLLDGDFDGDVIEDELAIYQPDLRWDVTLGKDGSTGTWLTGWGYGNRNYIGDFNGDGMDDVLLILQSDLKWYLAISDGTGFIAYPDALSGYGYGYDACVVDYDNDGSDEVIIEYEPSYCANLNKGTNTFDIETCSQNCGITKTCSEQGGIICPEDETCIDSWIDASDTDRCCSGECKPALVWKSKYYKKEDGTGQTDSISQPIDKDVVVSRINVRIKDFPIENKPHVDVCLYISWPNIPYWYPFMIGGFSEVICNHVIRYTNSSDWFWEAEPNLFVPKDSEILCGSTVWPSSGDLLVSFGNFSCEVALDDPSGMPGMRSLRFPYIDQATKPITGDFGESGQSPRVGYKSNNDFPLKVKNAAFFVSFPMGGIESEMDMCIYWMKNDAIYQQKCIPRQTKPINGNYEGYSDLLNINWVLPPGDKLFAQCTYYGENGSHGDCAAFVFVELPDDKKTYQGVFTNYGLIEPDIAYDYCYDPYNSLSFTHAYPSYFSDNASKKCMDLLMLYDPLEVTLFSDKYQGFIGDAIQLTTQHKRGSSPQYKFWHYDGTDFVELRDWSAEDNLYTQIQEQGINQYGVHIRDGDNGDFDAQSWIQVAGYHRSDINLNDNIEINELLAFINRWKISIKDVSMRELMEAIKLWKEGAEYL